MFLSLLTADAASQHGHEYSTPRAPSPSARSPSPRLPWSVFSYARPSPQPSKPSSPSRESVDDQPVTNKKSIMFADPPETTITEPASNPASRPASTHSIATTSTEDRTRRRAPRPKSIFNLAHPPPRHGPLHLRPKILLQLHQSHANSRPRPAYDAIPSTTFAPRLKRKFARVFRHRDKLGPDDVVIVKSGEYHKHKAAKDSDSEEDLEHREVIGVVCANLREGTTEICMDDDSVWVITHMQNGGYEFNTIDEHGLALKARWVPRPAANRRVSGSQNPSASNIPAIADDKKFTFSTISPDSRRHPIIASMTKTSIEVLEQYSLPTPSLTSPMNSPAQSPGLDPVDTPFGSEKARVFVTDAALRKFIVVTGIYVAFRESWSTAFKYNQSPSSCTASPVPASESRASIRNTMPSQPFPPEIGIDRSQQRTSTLATRPRRADSSGTAFIRRTKSERSRGRGDRRSPGADGPDEERETHRARAEAALLGYLEPIEDQKVSGEFSSAGEEPTPVPAQPTTRRRVRSLNVDTALRQSDAYATESSVQSTDASVEITPPRVEEIGRGCKDVDGTGTVRRSRPTSAAMLAPSSGTQSRETLESSNADESRKHGTIRGFLHRFKSQRRKK
ncbi:hypothetical protein K490DRAFT_55066 [Saccharata proteae CBS 121410]|uniref:Uncharacterized protein n=1 Tax=Saccharata proteae CBS 121410 TaxID=1314787 RepID=A0A6A5YEV4_9PEZI|nr:hypothetical protein K490DRAFT_55066 [Saccharata proteae CBS 121410]